MNKFLRLGAAGAVFAASMGMTTAAHAADTASADAFAEILSALNLTLDTNSKLDFGAMVVSGAGVVTLDADGTFDCTATNIVCSGTTEVASFSIDSGTGLKDVTINLPSSTTLLRAGGTSGTAADELELDNFTTTGSLNTSGSTPFYEVSLDSAGEAGFSVGGDLNFDGTEVPGSYTGTFSVSVEYS